MTIEDLALMVQAGFAETVTKGDFRNEISNLREEMATKKDLERLREDILIMINGFIGTVRKDYDELARRVKKIEEVVFKSRR